MNEISEQRMTDDTAIELLKELRDWYEDQGIYIHGGLDFQRMMERLCTFVEEWEDEMEVRVKQARRNFHADKGHGAIDTLKYDLGGPDDLGS